MHHTKRTATLAVMLLTHIVSHSSLQAEAFQAQTTAKKHSKIAMQMLVIEGPLANAQRTQDLHRLAKLVHFDLEFSDQLAVTLNASPVELEAKTLAALSKKGTDLCVYIKSLAAQPSLKAGHDAWSVEVVLKDATSSQDLFRKTFAMKADASFVHQAHCISDALFPVLTNEKGPHLSTLAYCKQLSPNKKVICLADYACKTEKVVVNAPTINVAPCWHSQAPVLFYSQFTRVNSRLMSFDIASQSHRIIYSCDGLAMQPTFSPDGSKAILCLSGQGNSELHLYDHEVSKKAKKRVYTQITHNKGNNASPCYLPNGTIVFCSDFQTNAPQLYQLDMISNTVKRLTTGKGYCAAPAYSAKNNAVVYTRYIKGVFQLCMLNLNEAHPKERQLTFNGGDKVESSWSACGRYVAFTFNTPYELGKKGKKRVNQIAALNLSNGAIKVLTSGPCHKSFPAWTGQSVYAL